MRNIFSIAILMLFAFASAMSMQDMRVAYYTTNTNPQDVQLKVVDYTNGGAGQELFAGDVFNGLTPNANGIVVAELKDFLPQQQQQGQQWSAINANVLNTSVTVDIYVDGTLYAQYRLDQLVLDQAQVGVFDNDGNFPPPLVTSTLGTDDDRWADLFVLGNSVHIGPNGGLTGNDELSFSYDDGTNTATFTSANNDFMTVVNDDVTFADQITVDGLTIGQGAGDDLSNSAFGLDALNSNNGGNRNTAMGTRALRDNVTGVHNTANGFQALMVNTGSDNTAVGYNSLLTNVGGNGNTAIGSNTLAFNTTGIRNTALGALALFDNTTGAYNIAIGFESATNNTTGDANVALGDAALHKNTTGDFNTALGSHALHEVTASGNVGIGRYAGNFIGSGTNNILIGNEAGNGNNQKADAVGSIAIGYQAYTLGDNSIAIGQGVNTTADNQVVIGNSSILENNFNGRVQQTIGYATNTAFGTNALNTNTVGGVGNNTAVGVNVMTANTTGDHNSAVGFESMNNNTTGRHNVAMGFQSLLNNIDGGNNTSIGSLTLTTNTSGEANVAIGRESLFDNTSGNNNISIGHAAGRDNTTGNQNIYIGQNAGRNINLQKKDAVNSIAIGLNTFTTKDNQIVFGNDDVEETRLSGAILLRNNAIDADNISGNAKYPILHLSSDGNGANNLPIADNGTIYILVNATGNPISTSGFTANAGEAIMVIRSNGGWYKLN